MASRRLLDMPAVRKQHILVEFSGLKHACPQGVFMSLSSGDPMLWTGVLFVRNGPYAPAILRFQISFPLAYPALPPLVTFSTDIFHPLITPLTTYMYTTDVQDGGTVSATDDERLPPGGFSLQHGFPDWFGRASKNTASSRQASGQFLQTPLKSPAGSVSGRRTPDTETSDSPTAPLNRNAHNQQVSVYEVLRYIRSTFDSAEVLDTVSLEASGNPGAWYAWRAHRMKIRRPVPPAPALKREEEWQREVNDDDEVPVLEGYQRAPGGTSALTSKSPAQWNWSGVWEVRVKKGVEASLADNVLYGNAVSNDELIRFLNLDDYQIQVIKGNLKRGLKEEQLI